MKTCLVTFIASFIFLSTHAAAQKPSGDVTAPDVIHWQAASAIEKADGSVEVIAYLSTERGFSLYEHKTTVTNAQGYQLDKVSAPGTIEIKDPLSGKPTYVYEEGEFTFIFKRSSEETNPPKEFTYSIRYIACTDQICLFPYTQNLTSPLIVYSQQDPQKMAALLSAKPIAKNNSVVDAASEDDFETRLANMLKKSDSFLFILLIVFIGGLITNLTPCVFPMIPITMRILSGQSTSPYKSSIAYASGILATYTLLGIVSASTGSFFGVLMANKWFNLGFAIMMFIFGLTMLGFGNFTKLQMLGGRLGTGKPSLKNAFFMGAGAGLVAAPCTGPILALLLAITAQSGEVARGSMMMFIYSFGFALPYVFLGRASASLQNIKAPPHVQLGVKILFAGVMFTLGLYYLRIPFYGFLAKLDNVWQPLYMICLPLGLASLGFVLWKEKLHNNRKMQLIPPLLIAFALFGYIRHSYSEGKRANKAAGLFLYKSEAKAFATARKENKPILVDSWAEWCEACKKMDITTFADPRVIKELSENWIFLKFDLTESNDKNDEIMERYGLSSLPTLAMLPATADFEGKKLIAGYVSAATLLNRLSEFKAELK